MKFERALHINQEEQRMILFDDIIHEENFEEVIEQLYCPHEGCEAKLVYNRRSTGKAYLSKRKGVSHISGCDYENDGVTERTAAIYIEENGRLSNTGIMRRKKDAMNALDDLLEPLKDDEKKAKNTPRARQKTVNSNSSDESKVIIQIKYDPNSSSVSGSENDRGENVYEPPFLQRNLHQISSKDAGKNLKTSAKIDSIMVDEANNQASIFGSLNGQKVTFVLPPAFFSNPIEVNADQMQEFLKILERYITSDSRELYLTTLCQSIDINMDDLKLFIYEPSFMAFQFIRGRKFKSLSDVVAAISTKAI